MYRPKLPKQLTMCPSISRNAAENFRGDIASPTLAEEVKLLIK